LLAVIHGIWAVTGDYFDQRRELELRKISGIVIPTEVGIYFSSGYRPSPV